MASTRPGLVKPALIGGALFGFLAGAPFVEWINCACCCLTVAAGFVAAFLYSRDARAAGAAFDAMSGVKIGLLAGAFYAVATTVTSAVSDVLFHEATTQWVLQILDEVPEISPELLEQIRAGAEHGFLPWVLLQFVANLGFGFVFATIGGLIAGAVFKSGPSGAGPEAAA